MRNGNSGVSPRTFSSSTGSWRPVSFSWSSLVCPSSLLTHPFPSVVLKLLGGIEVSRFLHRLGATGLIYVSIYHLFYILFSREGRRNFKLMSAWVEGRTGCGNEYQILPGRIQGKAPFRTLIIYGKIRLLGSLLGMHHHDLLRNSPVVQQFLHAELSPDRPAHRQDHALDEALLATLAIVFWHMYNAPSESHPSSPPTW